MSEPVLATTGLKRSFTQGDVTIQVLRGVDLAVSPDEIVALLGPSGSGKSTLLQAVGLLEGGFEGSIRLEGEEAATWTTTAAPGCGASCSALSISSTICCPISPRSRMSSCRNSSSGAEPQAAPSARERCSVRSALPSGSTIARRSSRAASSSASPSPARSPTSRHWFWPTSLPAISTNIRPTSSLPNS